MACRRAERAELLIYKKRERAREESARVVVCMHVCMYVCALPKTSAARPARAFVLPPRYFRASFPSCARSAAATDVADRVAPYATNESARGLVVIKFDRNWRNMIN